MKKHVLGLLCFVLTTLFPSVIWAHGGVGIEKDPCIRRAGPYLIHFAVYQPQFNSAEEYCTAVPKAGNVILVFDLVDPELRSLPLTIQVIGAVGAPEPKTVLYVPLQTYPTGVVSAEATLDQSGKYTAIVTLEGSSHSIQFPLRVAMWSPGFVAFVAVLFLSSALGYVFLGRKKGWSMSFGQKRRPTLRLVKE